MLHHCINMLLSFISVNAFIIIIITIYLLALLLIKLFYLYFRFILLGILLSFFTTKTSNLKFTHKFILSSNRVFIKRRSIFISFFPFLYNFTLLSFDGLHLILKFLFLTWFYQSRWNYFLVLLRLRLLLRPTIILFGEIFSIILIYTTQ